MDELVWTKDKPTKAGYYWYREARTYVVEVCFVRGERIVYKCGHDCDKDLSELAGEWAGPIPEPREPRTPVAVREGVGLLYDEDDHIIELPRADEVAREYGFVYAEQLVKHLHEQREAANA